MILWRWNIVVLDLGLVELAHELVDKAAPFVDLGSQLLVLCEHRVCEFCVVVVKKEEGRKNGAQTRVSDCLERRNEESSRRGAKSSRPWRPTLAEDWTSERQSTRLSKPRDRAVLRWGST